MIVELIAHDGSVFRTMCGVTSASRILSGLLLIVEDAVRAREGKPPGEVRRYFVYRPLLKVVDTYQFHETMPVYL